MRHFMIDLETLGRRAGCKILSIGAVEMNFDGFPREGSEFYTEVQRSQPGLHEDPETVEFWNAQAPSVRDRLFSESGKQRLGSALAQLNAFLRHGSTDSENGLEVCVWGNGSEFDNAILTAAYATVGLKPAWPFWNNRCFRTLKNLGHGVPKPTFVGEPHNALDDARNQARYAEIIAAELLKRGVAV